MKPSHFFKFVSDSILQDDKLRIPRKFAEKYVNNFRDFILLKVPSGAVWQVELNTLDGDIWLCNGWKQFADYYSIRFGHLLVFKYKGDFNLNVTIFDMSATEIEYPMNPDHGEPSLKKSHLEDSVKVEVEDDQSIQILEAFPMNEMSSNSLPAIVKGKSGAYQRAKAFKSRQPYFILKMGKTYVSGKSAAYIPAPFAKKHLDKKCGGMVLQDSSGRTWVAKCAFDQGPERYRLFIHEFLRDNDIKVGDVCHFQILSHDDLRLKVKIFREFE